MAKTPDFESNSENNIVDLSYFAKRNQQDIEQGFLEEEQEQATVNYYSCMPTINIDKLSRLEVCANVVQEPNKDVFVEAKKESFVSFICKKIFHILTLGFIRKKEAPSLPEKTSENTRKVSRHKLYQELKGHIFYNEEYEIQLLKGKKKVCLIEDALMVTYLSSYHRKS